MVTSTTYPGVYIFEFNPGAPIEGVGTSTAAFIGTAASGPINTPTLIQSWDAFVATFGGFLAEPPVSYLAPAVFGFFLNGGTTCYIVRASTGANATIGLTSRQGGGNPDPVLVARARREGPAGNAIAVEVSESSRLATLLGNRLTERQISAVSGDRLTLTVNDNQGYVSGLAVTLIQGNDVETVVVDHTVAGNQVVLRSAIPGAVDFTNGTMAPAGLLFPRSAQTDITAVSAERDRLTVASNTGFVAGDQLLLDESGTQATVSVARTEAADVIVLSAPIPGGHDFTNGTARIADLQPGQTTIQLAVPPALSLNQALPRGATISLTHASAGTGEVRTVASSSGNTIKLTSGLETGYALSDPTDLPMITSLEFDLSITDAGSGENESFTQLSMHPDHPNYWSTAVSQLVTLAEPDTALNPVPADLRPVAAIYQLANGVPDDRAAALADIIGNPTAYLSLLNPIDEISLVAIPGVTDAAVQQAIVAHCELMFDRFAILDSIPGSTTTTITDQVASVRSDRGFGALYFPWIVARNPVTRRDELWPPSGHIAGIYARTDAERGVHKAPANTNIRGALGLEVRLTDVEQGRLNLDGIDVLRVFPGQAQPIVWGARTTSQNTNWQYINVRRLFLFLEESIEEGIRWAVFEPNNLQLWQKLRRTITEFLTRVWRDGALFGATAEEAFYVRIDEALNPFTEQQLGRLNIEIGVRPTYPAEFIIVRIGIWQGGSEVAEG